MYASRSGVSEEIEPPRGTFDNVYFTLMIPFTVCEFPSNGDCVDCLRISSGTVIRASVDCSGASKCSCFELLSELNDDILLEAIVYVVICWVFRRGWGHI